VDPRSLVTHFDQLEDRELGVFTCLEAGAVHQLFIQDRLRTFHHCVVVAITRATHALLQVAMSAGIMSADPCDSVGGSTERGQVVRCISRERRPLDFPCSRAHQIILPKRLGDLERLSAPMPVTSAADARSDCPPDRYRSRFETCADEDFLANFAASLAFDGFGSRFSSVDPFNPPAREL